MTFVLDASSALRLVLDDEDVEARRTVEEWLTAGGDAVVPALFLQEVTNALVSATRRGRLSDREAYDHLARLARLPISVAGRTPPPAALMDLSLQHALTAYDASYLELAVHLRVPLLTHDEALRSAANSQNLPRAPEGL